MTAAPFHNTGLTADPHALGASWDAMTEPGHVYEVRTLCKGRTGPLGMQGTVSGFFNDQQAFVAAVAPITGDDAAGVYVTLSPVDPTLLARSPNRLSTRPIAATKDADVIRRRRFLIDVDAANPADTSATDEERAAALARRDEIHAWLHDTLGWCPARVVTSSGNGGGLIFAIDLPNDEDARDLIKRALQALDARFTTPGVATVDVSVSNASRISRVAGTVTAKGTPTPERPWRQATAVYPDGAGLVTRTQLEALVATRPTKERSARHTRDTAHGSASSGVSGDGAGDRFADLLAHGSPAGQRHQDMVSLLGHYIARGLSTPEVQVLGRVWADRSTPPVPYADIDTTIRDLTAAEARKRGGATDQADKDDTQGEDDSQATPPLTPAATADALRTQRAALKSAYATIETLKEANAAKIRLLLSDAFAEGEKKALVFMLQRLGYEFGAPLPASFGEVFIPETEMAHAGLCVNSFRTARKRLVTDGVLIERMRQPGTESATGHPYTVVTVDGERLAHIIVGLDPASAAAAALAEARAARAAARSEEAHARFDKAQAVRGRREEQDRAHRQMAAAMGQERRKHQEEAERLAHQLTEKAAEAEAMRQAAADAQREAARIVAEAQQAQQAQWGQRESLPCGGCGAFIAVTDWRCDDCRAVGTAADQFTGAESIAVQLTPTFGAYGTGGREGSSGHTVALPLAPKVGVNSTTTDPQRTARDAGKVCRGGCGAPTPSGVSYCGACRSRPPVPLPIAARYGAAPVAAPVGGGGS